MFRNIVRYYRYMKNREKYQRWNSILADLSTRKISEPLWKRKFDPITEQPEPEPKDRITYRIVPLFGDLTWLRRLHFNHYLRALQFVMTTEGVKRYCDGKEVEQKFFED